MAFYSPHAVKESLSMYSCISDWFWKSYRQGVYKGDILEVQPVFRMTSFVHRAFHLKTASFQRRNIRGG